MFEPLQTLRGELNTNHIDLNMPPLDESNYLLINFTLYIFKLLLKMLLTFCHR